jgi:hypothetical protein
MIDAEAQDRMWVRAAAITSPSFGSMIDFEMPG